MKFKLKLASFHCKQGSIVFRFAGSATYWLYYELKFCRQMLSTIGASGMPYRLLSWRRAIWGYIKVLELHYWYFCELHILVMLPFFFHFCYLAYCHSHVNADCWTQHSCQLFSLRDIEILLAVQKVISGQTFS